MDMFVTIPPLFTVRICNTVC